MRNRFKENLFMFWLGRISSRMEEGLNVIAIYSDNKFEMRKYSDNVTIDLCWHLTYQSMAGGEKK